MKHITFSHVAPPVFFMFFLLFAHLANSQTDHFIFNGFSKANLSLDESVVITPNGLLQLTNQSQYIFGHAFYPFPVINSSVSSFNTSFVFGIIPSEPKKGGHGFAFAVSPFNHLSRNSSSHFLGLFNSSDDRNPSNHVFVVEFDTIGASGAFGDLNVNHVGVDIDDGINSFYPWGSTRQPGSAGSGRLHDIFRIQGQRSSFDQTNTIKYFGRNTLLLCWFGFGELSASTSKPLACCLGISFSQIFLPHKQY